ncbi:MAG: hypothetical protein ACKO0Z_06100 [Betaproteobacteria bacterium]
MNRLGNILNRLISTRAYAAGRLPAVELEIEAIREKLKALEAERIALPMTIAHCDQRIKELSLIDVDDIRAIRLNGRHSTSPYGAVKRAAAEAAQAELKREALREIEKLDPQNKMLNSAYRENRYDEAYVKSLAEQKKE